MEHTYKIEFARIGRNRNVGPLQVTVPEREAWQTADYLAHKIHGHAKRHLASRYFEVVVDLDAGTGYVFTGQPAGDFTIAEAAP
jgi:hypothetical protein